MRRRQGELRGPTPQSESHLCIHAAFYYSASTFRPELKHGPSRGVDSYRQTAACALDCLAEQGTGSGGPLDARAGLGYEAAELYNGTEKAAQ